MHALLLVLALGLVQPDTGYPAYAMGDSVLLLRRVDGNETHYDYGVIGKVQYHPKHGWLYRVLTTIWADGYSGVEESRLRPFKPK